MITLSRRKLIGGLTAFIAAPAIVRVSSLMPMRAIAATPVVIGEYERQEYMLGFARVLDRALWNICKIQWRNFDEGEYAARLAKSMELA